MDRNRWEWKERIIRYSEIYSYSFMEEKDVYVDF